MLHDTIVPREKHASTRFHSPPFLRSFGDRGDTDDDGGSIEVLAQVEGEKNWNIWNFLKD